MTTLQEIEAALPKLSAEELAQVETLIQSVRREREETGTTSDADAAPGPRRRMVKDSYGNGLWVMEAVPGVVLTPEMMRKILDDDEEADFQEHLARFYPERVNQSPKKDA